MTPKAADAARGADLEQGILEAARDLLAEAGLPGLSMRAVAERVGVSATALYHYFENKDALVRRVVERGFRRFREYLSRAADHYPPGTLDRVAAIGRAYVQFALENQAYFRVLFSMQRPDPQAIEDLPEGGGYELFRQAVVDAMEAGTMRRVHPDLMVMYLWCVVHGVVTISLACRMEDGEGCGPEGIPDSPEELFEAFRPLVRHGIAAPHSGEEATDVA